MTLDRLDEKERSLLLQIRNLVGSIEEKSREIEIRGIFDDYKQVHSQYADLAQENSEALKRGLFLQWYAFVEPPFLSGINGTNPQAERRIINIFNEKIIQNIVDFELHLMVSHYMVWEFVFDRFETGPNLVRLFTNGLDNDYIIQYMKQSNFNHRGQMGIYWQSITSSD